MSAEPLVTGPGVDPVDARAFRGALGEFATGVCVLTALGRAGGCGATVNSFTSVSLDPPLVLVCLKPGSSTFGVVAEVGAFAVSVLAAHQRHVAAWFADPARPRGRRQFDGLGWRAGRVTGAPVLDGALAWLECAVTEVVPAGDHVVVLARVLAVGHRAGAAPLTFHCGRYGTVARSG